MLKIYYQLALAICLFAGHHSHAQTIRVGAASHLEPYGAAVEEMLRKAGFNPVITFMPAERSLQSLKNGDVDLEFFRQAGAVQDFRDQVRLIGPQACINLVGFVRAGSDFRADKASIGTRRLGVLLGGKLAESIARDFGTDVQRIPSHEQLFKMLERDRVEVVIETEVIGLAKIKELNLSDKIKALQPPLHSTQVFLVLRNHLESWGPRIEKVSAAMTKSGRWIKLLEDVNDAGGLPRKVGLSCLNPGKAK